MAFNYIPHPDDEKMLMNIRRYLIGYRITNGWTQADLSQRVNGTTHAAITLEKGSFDWGLKRLQDWAHAFDLRLTAIPQMGRLINEMVEADPSVTAFKAAMEGQDEWRPWQRMYLTTYLKTAREVQRISRPELGARLGITAGAVSSYEIHADNVRLIRLLNYAQALGGRIELTVF